MWERMDTVLEDCKNIAREAGREILRYYENEEFWVKEKSDHTPVTQADVAANEIILGRLKAKYPEAAFLAEESADDRSRLSKEWCFIIDPLDGTKEFIKRSDEFTVNIALVRDHHPVMGVIYLPVYDDLYWAVKGRGARSEKHGEPVREIHVSDRTEDIRACLSKSNSAPNAPEILAGFGIRHVIFAGSALKGCMIAAGDAEIYYRSGLTSEWDTAAMQCIVEEAGGILCQMDDTEMTYNRENTLNEKGFYILNREENRLELK